MLGQNGQILALLAKMAKKCSKTAILPKSGWNAPLKLSLLTANPNMVTNTSTRPFVFKTKEAWWTPGGRQERWSVHALLTTGVVHGVVWYPGMGYGWWVWGTGTRYGVLATICLYWPLLACIWPLFACIGHYLALYWPLLGHYWAIIGQIPPNTANYRQIHAKYGQLPPNTAKYSQIQPNWREIQPNWREIQPNWRKMTVKTVKMAVRTVKIAVKTEQNWP